MYQTRLVSRIPYIYSPFEEIPNYAPAVRFVFLPVIILSGLWIVERPCPSTTYFEKIGLTRHSNKKGKLYERR